MLQQQLWKGGKISFATISQLWSDLGDALTLYIRENPVDPFNFPAQGAANSMQTCIGVRWMWLIYPFATYLVVIAFAIWMMMQVNHTPAWKGSLLPALMCGVDDALRGDASQLKSLEKIAKGTMVQLMQTEGGLRLVEVHAKTTGQEEDAARGEEGEGTRRDGYTAVDS